MNENQPWALGKRRDWRQPTLSLGFRKWLDCMGLGAGLKPDWQSQGCCSRGVEPRLPGWLVANIQALPESLKWYTSCRPQKFFKKFINIKDKICSYSLNGNVCLSKVAELMIIYRYKHRPFYSFIIGIVISYIVFSLVVYLNFYFC